MTEKIVIVGFSFSELVVYRPLIKDLFQSTETEVFQNLKTMREGNRSKCVDFVIMLTCCIGFDIEKHIKEIAEWYPEARIVAISPHHLSPLIGKLFLKGGADILFWDIHNEDEYQRVVCAIENNRRYIPKDVLDVMKGNVPLDDYGLMKLSNREKQAITMTMNGSTLKDIAQEMNISLGTACSMRSKYMKKMGVNSVPLLVRKGLQMNLLHFTEADYAL